MRKELKGVFTELLSGVGGNSFFLRPAIECLRPDEYQDRYARGANMDT
jgi:hypothetical protein